MSVALRKEVEVSEAHFVHFYRDNRFLSGALLEYINVGVEKNEGVIIIATEAHIIEICKYLPKKIISETRFVDADWILKNIFPKGILNPHIFTEQISILLSEMQGYYKRNRIFVELLDLICEKKYPGAALELETCWNQFLENRDDLVVMCSYNLKNLSPGEYQSILRSHSFSSGNEDENSSIDFLCRKISALEIRNSEAKLSSNQVERSVDLEKRVVHSLKLADLGEMAAGLSHELMNPITIIGSYSQMISLALEGEDFESKEFLEKQLAGINSTVNRMAGLVKNILNYSRTNASKRDFLVVEAVSDAVDLLNPVLRSQNVAIQVFASPVPIYMHGDSGQILQVIFNLLTNARDAIFEAHGSKGGKIMIHIEASDEAHFRIVCADNGKGIEDKLLKEMWKPFYTTKHEGKGTGLGLSIIKKIIQDSGGSICCESVPDKGTSFTITLPGVFRN